MAEINLSNPDRIIVLEDNETHEKLEAVILFDFEESGHEYRVVALKDSDDVVILKKDTENDSYVTEIDEDEYQIVSELVAQYLEENSFYEEDEE